MVVISGSGIYTDLHCGPKSFKQQACFGVELGAEGTYTLFLLLFI